MADAQLDRLMALIDTYAQDMGVAPPKIDARTVMKALASRNAVESALADALSVKPVQIADAERLLFIVQSGHDWVPQADDPAWKSMEAFRASIDEEMAAVGYAENEGAADDVPQDLSVKQPVAHPCPICGSAKTHLTMGNAVGNTHDCLNCGTDFTPAAPQAAPECPHKDNPAACYRVRCHVPKQCAWEQGHPPPTGAQAAPVGDERREQLLAKLPSFALLLEVDDDENTGRRPCPISFTIDDVRALRLILEAWQARAAYPAKPSEAV